MLMGFRALIVDDSAMMRQFAILSLAPISDLVCGQACDGMQALKELADGSYDILITDVNMPRIDGIKLVEMIRRDPQCRDLPVIVMTTEGADDAKRAALAVGADGYLTKPLQTAQLIKMVRKLLDPEQRRHG
jgi:two-component system chemotaxis response regulator CheY